MKGKSRKLVIFFICMLVVIEFFSLFLMYKSFSNKEIDLDNVKLQEIKNNNMFAILLQQEDGSYLETDDIIWPTSGYEYNAIKSGCIDNNGSKIDNALTYNKDTNLATVDTAKTAYCYLYFDLPAVAFAIYSETDNSLNFYKRIVVPEVGDEFNGNLVTEVFTGIETDAYSSSSPWEAEYGELITNVKVVDVISPISTALWFEEMYVVESIDVNNLDTSNVTSMLYMFNECNSEEGISITGLDKFNTSKVTDMRGMFQFSELKGNLDLSNWDVSNVTDMSGMFSEMGDGASTKDISLNLSNWNLDNVTDISGIFSNVGMIAQNLEINLLNWNVSNIENMSNLFYNTGIDSGSVSIIGLDSWNVSNVTNMSQMFYQTANQSAEFEISDISGWNTGNVTNMSSMFEGTAPNTNEDTWSLDLSGWDVSKVTSYENFTNVDNITSPF